MSEENDGCAAKTFDCLLGERDEDSVPTEHGWICHYCYEWLFAHSNERGDVAWEGKTYHLLRVRGVTE